MRKAGSVTDPQWAVVQDSSTEAIAKMSWLTAIMLVRVNSSALFGSLLESMRRPAARQPRH